MTEHTCPYGLMPHKLSPEQCIHPEAWNPPHLYDHGASNLPHRCCEHEASVTLLIKAISSKEDDLADLREELRILRAEIQASRPTFINDRSPQYVEAEGTAW